MQSNPEYDSYIRKLIDGAVARLVNQGDFENAIDALHDIIEKINLLMTLLEVKITLTSFKKHEVF